MATQKETHVTLKFKTLLIIIGIVVSGGGLTGGGLAAFDFATDASVKDQVNQKANEIMTTENVRHTAIDRTLEERGVIIDELKVGVESIQDTQIRGMARTEARRLTSHIINRASREAHYDRLFLRNIKRLERGRDPCSNLDCD